MAFAFEFLGFGSKRRTALRAFDRALSDLQVNPAYIDDGMRYAIYKWVTDEEADLNADPGYVDRRMTAAAALISFCVLGFSETTEVWGETVAAERRHRFDAVLAASDNDGFDTRIIKLVLAKGIAAPDIAAAVTLDVDG